MLCPVCNTNSLQATTLEMKLPAYQCESCSGIYISSNQYLAWLREHGPVLSESQAPDESIPTWDTDQTKVCPECRHLLFRYKVWPGLNFSIDHCGSCNGIWFDRNEWKVLVSHNLHDKINLFFTKPWQKKLRIEEKREALDRLYRQKFGDSDYARVKEVKTWLDEHPQRSMLLAFLQADNPYGRD